MTQDQPFTENQAEIVGPGGLSVSLAGAQTAKVLKGLQAVASVGLLATDRATLRDVPGRSAKPGVPAAAR
jgi:hypothetical protein